MKKQLDRKVIMKWLFFIIPLITAFIYEKQVYGMRSGVKLSLIFISALSSMAIGGKWGIEYDKTHKDANVFDFGFKTKRIPHFVKGEPTNNSRALLAWVMFLVTVFLMLFDAPFPGRMVS